MHVDSVFQASPRNVSEPARMPHLQLCRLLAAASLGANGVICGLNTWLKYSVRPHPAGSDMHFRCLHSSTDITCGICSPAWSGANWSLCVCLISPLHYSTWEAANGPSSVGLQDAPISNAVMVLGVYRNDVLGSIS